MLACLPCSYVPRQMHRQRLDQRGGGRVACSFCSECAHEMPTCLAPTCTKELRPAFEEADCRLHRFGSPTVVREAGAACEPRAAKPQRFRQTGHRGPCPPPGKPHRYFFELYALNAKLNLKAGATKGGVEAAMKRRILAHAEMIGKYGRSRRTAGRISACLNQRRWAYQGMPGHAVSCSRRHSVGRGFFARPCMVSQRSLTKARNPRESPCK